ncbi:peptidoglycan/xylan/chitin deacetylase (PgdA/CDA1 family) [Tumebacillus sp. BK434]|uniref:polysaccharide deacetylase family protein n=1 Tax=Tumebacillus sp. BK434 TaxID=2512169 RepID=UPI00104A83A8|nr:polysaccharide deacetylase family protein [Tumebacillus sp. BK434]TCP52534.1 peptidoglycan/xylan/chitin deacetylase (PgdA/CDA1 family) [Tumebacillus sp. BK434]
MRKILLFFTLLLILTCSFNTGAHAQTQAEYVAIAYNDKLVRFPDALPEVVSGVTYLPVRFFAEAMGARVEYNSARETVRIETGSQTVLIDILQHKITMPGGETRSVAVYMKQGRVMVPFRLIGETFGYEITYLAKGPLARAIDSRARLTDEQFYTANKQTILAEKAKLPDKIAYLTFDDGPNQYTAQILDTLARYQAKATFFMLSGQIESYPAQVKRMAQSFHGLALHGVTHNANKIYASPQTVVGEMEACNAALTRVTGLRTNMVRVPYGSIPWMTQSYRDALVNAGYRMWDWTVDSFDSRSTNPDPDDIVREVASQTAGQTAPVILLHDRQATLAALPRILQQLQQMKYELRPLQGSMRPHNFWNDRR